MLTDCWKAYPQAAKEAGCNHQTVNHSEGFINKVTGLHTNNVEGIHSVLKKKCKISIWPPALFDKRRKTNIHRFGVLENQYQSAEEEPLVQFLQSSAAMDQRTFN